MTPEDADRNPVVERRSPRERKPVQEALFNGDFKDMWGLVDVMIDDLEDNAVWKRLAAGTASIEELDYDGDGFRMTGAEVANTVRVIDAVAGERFTGYKGFEVYRSQALPSNLTEAQKLGATAQKLVAFFNVPGDIEAYRNDRYPGDPTRVGPVGGTGRVT